MKKIILSALFVILVIGVGQFFGDPIAHWGMALKWHLFNDNKIVFDEMRLDLPYRWWVDSRDIERVILNVVPPYGIDFYGIVVIRKELISKEELFSFKKRRKISQAEVIFDKIETRTIGDQQAFGIIYRVVNSSYSEDISYEYWTIPSKGLVVSAIKIPKQYRRILFELFSRISFNRYSGQKLN